MEPSESSDTGRRKAPWHLWLAVAFGGLFALTAVVPDWLELFGLEGIDHGDGSAEGVILVLLGVAAVATGAYSYLSMRRAARSVVDVRSRDH